MMDLDATSLIVGYVIGAGMIMAVVAMVAGAKSDPHEPDDDWESPEWKR